MLLEFVDWRPRAPARHFVPAFAPVAPRPFSVRFELAARTANGWSPWVATTTLGPAEFAPLSAGSDGLESQVDLWVARDAVDAVRLRIRLRADEPDALLGAPWLATLSASDLDPIVGAHQAGACRLEVPRVSQIEAGGAIGTRICSPTSVAMVLAYLSARDDVARLAAEMFHPALDIYGVWPAAILAAARRGVLGYLLRFPDWASAAWCLTQGLPIIVSVRYAASELSGAAIPATPGHLLVLTGYEDDQVFANDPAAAEAATVARRYRRDEIERVWLERAGVGYVLFRPPAIRHV